MSAQSNYNKRISARRKHGTPIIILPPLSKEDREVNGYFQDKWTDFYQAKSKGRLYRKKFPGKDAF